MPQVTFKPDWAAHGKAAPFKRNDLMLATLPIGVILFPGTGIQENLSDTSGIMYSVLITAIAYGRYYLKMNGVLAFWLAYIFTRPMGASYGDLFAQPTEYGGLGFGTTWTSLVFLTGIVAVVVIMSIKFQRKLEN